MSKNIDTLIDQFYNSSAQFISDLLFFFSEREKPLPLLLGQQCATLSQSVQFSEDERHDEEVSKKEREPGAPAVGRWGAEWPS